MDSFHVLMLFPAITSVLVVVAAVLNMNLKSMSRDVSPKPFASRKEYLEAALEMDLDLFLERVRVTPRYVIEKSLPQDKKVCADRAIAKLSEIHKRLDLSHANPFANPWVPFKSPVEGVAGVSNFLGPSKSFAVGQWVRIKLDSSSRTNWANCLAQVVDINAISVTCRMPDGSNAGFTFTDVEEAYPKTGEWWQYENTIPFQVTVAPDSSGRAVKEGRLWPVNFGKGNPEKSRGWFRMKLTGELVYRAADHAPGFHRYNQDGPTAQLLLSRVEVEPAYPSVGEWWVKMPCIIKHTSNRVGWLEGPHQFMTASDQYSRTAAECGCLVPVNYGKGLEQKSGVA